LKIKTTFEADPGKPERINPTQIFMVSSSVYFFSGWKRANVKEHSPNLSRELAKRIANIV